MSNLIDHARRELRLAGFHLRDADYGGRIPDAVLPLIGVLAAQGHSGFSAHMTIDIFSKLARFEPLTALTSDSSEWHKTDLVDEDLWQSSRKSSCFSRDGGKTYYDIAEPRDLYGQFVIHESEKRPQSDSVTECCAQPPAPPAGETVVRPPENR